MNHGVGITVLLSLAYTARSGKQRFQKTHNEVSATKSLRITA
jgi:hypothetical protein